MEIEKKDVVNYLWKIDSRNEISELWNILKRRHKQLDEIATTEFKIGDKAKFVRKSGLTIEGTVKKINPTTIILKTDNGNWRVTATALTKI